MTEPAAPADAAVSLDHSPELAMPALHRAVIGPIGLDYYLPLFSRFEAAGEATMTWNWSACLFNMNWLFFRGLWGVALVFAAAMLGMAVVLFGLGQWVFELPPELHYGLIAAGLSLGFLVSGAWGNALYFNHSRKAMMAAVEANPTLELACAQLRQQASSRGRFIRILIANVLLLVAAAAAYGLLAGSDASPGTAAPEATAVVAPATPASLAASAVAETAPAASAAASEIAPVVVSNTTAPEPAPEPAPAPAPAPEPSASTASAASAASAASTASAASAAAVALPPPAPSAVLAARASKAAHAAFKAVSAAPAATPASAPVATELSTQVAPVQASAASANAPPTPKLKPKAIAATEPFWVNAGLFAQPDNARKTLARLKAAGLPAFSQELQTSQGPRTRVRAGPFATRAQAQAAVKKIQAMKLDAALVKS